MKKKNNISRAELLIICLTVFLCMIVTGFMFLLNLFSPEMSFVSIIASLVFFDRYVVEFLIILLFGIWLINGNGFFRIICYALIFIFISLYTIQFTAYYQSGELISALAVENINHISLLLNAPFIIGLIFFLSVYGCWLFYLERKCLAHCSLNSLVITSLIIVLLASILHNSPAWLPAAVLKQRRTYYAENYLTRRPPARALYKTLLNQHRIEPAIPLDPDECSRAEKLGFNINPEQRYPLIKDYIYKGAAPFKKIADAPALPNIIVFFTEGYSARSINYYGCSKYPGLTPNIDNFARHSMAVFNYFNHTAATYRGLHGQLCSLYPKYGGEGGWHTNYQNIPKSSYLSLNHILDNYGYETIFFDCHRKDKAFVDEMMNHLGFNQVWNAEELSRQFLNSAEPLHKEALSDVQFYESFIDFLKKRLKTSTHEAPFFIGLYNLGTHAWQKLSKDGKQYRRETNISINTIHTLDFAFGKFWQYYQNSAYAKDTIVIFTADHCHYQEKAFIAAFDEPGYQRLFVDRIPLIIHDPSRELPLSFDASYATSIDFTPSLIHYLGLANQKNPFIGTSIFSDNRKNFGVASYNNEYFIIDSTKIHRWNFSKTLQQELSLIKKIIGITHQLELDKRIWRE